MLKRMIGFAGLAMAVGMGSATAAESTSGATLRPTMESMAGRWMPDSRDRCSGEEGLFFLTNGVAESTFNDFAGTWRYEIKPDGTVVMDRFSVSPNRKPPPPDDLRRAEGTVVTLRMIDADTFEGTMAGPNVDQGGSNSGLLVRCAATGSTGSHVLAGRWVERGKGDCAGNAGVFFLENGVLVWEDNNIQGIARYELQPDQAIVIKDFVASPLSEGPLDKEAVGAVVTMRMKDGGLLEGSVTGPNISEDAQLALSRCPVTN